MEKFKDMKTKDIFMYSLGIVIVIGFFSTLIYMIKTDRYQTEVNMIVGTLIGSFVTVISFFFGSTKNSAEKTDMLYNSKPVKPTQNDEIIK